MIWIYTVCLDLSVRKLRRIIKVYLKFGDVTSFQLHFWHFEKIGNFGRAKMCLMPYANNKGADQPAHPRSLISTFVVHCLDSVICILALSKVSRF